VVLLQMVSGAAHSASAISGDAAPVSSRSARRMRFALVVVVLVGVAAFIVSSIWKEGWTAIRASLGERRSGAGPRHFIRRVNQS
jgi:hypothetical protein